MTCARCGDEAEPDTDGTSRCCGARLAGPETFGEDWLIDQAVTA